ncbi:MAG: DsbA family protein [Arcobacter sp.]|nr:DsbA family protein [Arcobacter sp.]
MIYTLYHVHDPMCSWCYAFKPTLDELRKNLKDNIKLVHVVGGLAKHSNEDMPLNQQEMISNIWYEIEAKVGTKFNHDFWKNCKPRRSTYLSCQATMLARYDNKEEEMIEAIQEAYYLKAMNPSDSSTLVQLAKQIGMDEVKFEKDLHSEKIEKDLMDELNLRRSINVRSFPSLVLKYKKETYPINIQFGDYKAMLAQIEDMIENTYF